MNKKNMPEMYEIRCKNKMCALYNIEHPFNCSGTELGLSGIDVRTCNIRVIYTQLVKRQVHDDWIDSKRGDWNKYQKAWRHQKDKENV
jgi:hypothetical protein